MSRRCNGCGEEYQRIASHWSQSSCRHPDISNRQWDICTGMLLGDAYINSQNGRNPLLRSKMINEDFLEWVSEELESLNPHLSRHMTAEESANDIARRKEFSTDPDNYSDIYELRTMRHPRFRDLRSWYDGGKKRFPESLSLTPMILKVWYCCDGSYDNRVSIYSVNENDRPEYLLSLFDNVGIDAVWQDGCSAIRVNKSDEHQFFDYVEDPLPGFEYKWGDHV